MHAGIAITADTYSHVRPEVEQAAADLVASLILGGNAYGRTWLQPKALQIFVTAGWQAILAGQLECR